MSKKTSIIVTCWNKAHFMAMCGMATIAAIRAFTNPEEYELIVIETRGVKLWDGYGVLDLKNAIHIEREMTEDQGYPADMNQGAKLATGDYLCFIENDVIVHENWLTDLRYYLENDLCDAIVPNQLHFKWADQQKFKTQTHEESMHIGIQEQGLMMIKREIFEQTGGWDERFRKVYAWRPFEVKLHTITSRIYTTDKVSISHIGGATYWWSIQYDKKDFSKQGTIEAEIMKKEFP